MSNGSVIRQRILGQRLRGLRGRARLSLGEAAERLEMSTSALSRIETGQQTPNVHLMKSLLDLYGITADRWDEYLQLTRDARQKGWWRAYSRHDTYVGLEADATLVREFAIGYPPGLLQTAAYARAMFTTSWRQHAEADVENGVRLRMIRQKRLTSTDDPLDLVAVIDESVLHRNVGGPDVLAGQLAHLAEAAQLPTVALHVLPFAGGRRPTMASGITVLSFGDLGHGDIGFVEHGLGGLTLEKESEVHRARLAFDRLRSDALDPADSLALIRRVAEQH